jgi:AraC family transcriptional regulator
MQYLFSPNEKYERALLSTLVHIQTNLDDTLNLDLLAARAGFSPFHFHRVFRDAIGEGVKGYIRRLRLERAAARLRISDETILRIALDSGFKTHESFTRAFAKQFGVNPAGYREAFLRKTRERKRQLRPRYLADYDPSDETGLLPNGSTARVLRLERTRPIQVAFVRHVGPYEGLLEPGTPLSLLWEELFDWGHANGLIDAGSLLLGIPQDDPSVTPAEKQRFDVCVQIPEIREPSGHIGCQTIPAGLYGVGRHYGGFENLADTYSHVFNSLVIGGEYALRSAAPFEMYSHAQVKGDIRIHFTDVYLPVQKIEAPRRKNFSETE